MLKAEDVWPRVASRFPGLTLKDFRYQGINSTYTVGASGTAQNQAVNFGAGAIILGVMGAAQLTSVAGTQQYRPPLDLFSMSCIYQADNRSVVGTSEAIGSSIFGPYGDQFPALELVMPQNTSLIYNFTNLTSSAIQITLTHHCLLRGAVG